MKKAFGAIAVLATLWLATGQLHADAVYDISFSDAKPNTAILSNAVGTFAVNSADQLTSFTVSFTVQTAYSFEEASGTPGEVLTFDSSSFGANPPTYNPSNGSFVTSAFTVSEQQPSDPNNGAVLTIDGGRNGNYYYFDAISQNEFSSGPIDSGTFVITLAPPSSPQAPEPATGAVCLLGMAAVLFVSARKIHE